MARDGQRSSRASSTAHTDALETSAAPETERTDAQDACSSSAPQLTPSFGASRRRRYGVVALITLTSMFLYADQNLIGPNMSAIAEDLAMSEEEKDVRLGGLLQLAFFVVGSPASLVIGYYADRVHRVRLFFWTTIIGEGPCLATYWVTTYWQLFALRAMTGIAVGGCLPLLFSLCGDIFASHERSYVASFLTIATGAGIALGQLVAGTVGPAYGWRLPFILTSAPAILLATLMLLVVDEPKRGEQEEEVHRRRMLRSMNRPNVPQEGEQVPTLGADDGEDMSYKAKMNWKKAKRQLRVKTNVLIFCQGLPGTVPWGVLNSYFVDFLHKQKGMTVPAATGAISVFGVGSAIGTIIGGITGQRIYNKRKSRLPVLMGATTAIGALPAYYYLNVNHYGPGRMGLYFTCFMAGVFSSVTPPNVRALLLNVNPPEARGTIFAFYSQIDDVGKGGGPALVALLIVTMGRRVAFNVAFSFWFLCAIFLACIAFTVEQDVQLQQRDVLEALDANNDNVDDAAASDGAR